MTFIICICALLIVLAASSSTAVMVPMFTRNSAPNGWIQVAPASPDSPVHFHVSLSQQNLDQLDRVFWEVSDPDHANYQNFLTADQIQSLVSPSAAARQTVLSWLADSGVTRLADFVDSIEAWTSVSVASKMFDTQFYHCQHTDTGKRVVRALGTVSVPQSVHDVIDSVLGLSTFPVPHLSLHRHAPTADAPIPENDAIIPQTIWSLYSMPTNITSGSSSIGQGVIEWEHQSFNPADLAMFATNVSVKIPAFNQSQIIGPNDPTEPGDEASLDIEFIAGINPSASNWFWIEGDSIWLYGFAVHFLNTSLVPNVISISYGWWEGDQCEQGIGAQECQKLGVNSRGYVERVNTEFKKIGVRGVSVFVSSGDAGAHTRVDEMCMQPRTLADFPGSSPYITSVGATQVNNETFFDASIAPICANTRYNWSCVKSGTEVAVSYNRSFFTSGGGFSNISRRLSYQEDAVQAYLKSDVKFPPASYFNHTGRAYPDVSAVGHNGFIINYQSPELIGGTSQSSPTFAAVVALLAEEFKQKTGKSFGFINPLLYKMWADDPSTFIDVTEGDNICTEYGCAKSCTGFIATKGWDAVTGLGSPNYANMLSYISSLADRVVARRQAKNVAPTLAKTTNTVTA